MNVLLILLPGVSPFQRWVVTCALTLLSGWLGVALSTAAAAGWSEVELGGPDEVL